MLCPTHRIPDRLDNARFLEYARASICEVQDGLTEARQKKYIDDKLYDRLWVLARRALGTNINYMKYLKWCVRTGAKPWLKDDASTSPKPPNPRTKNPRTENS